MIRSVPYYSILFLTLLATPAQSAQQPLKHKKCQKHAKEMVCIPGGSYFRGSNRNKHSKWPKFRAESPRHKVTLSTFYVDKYEITNAQYLECMKAGHCNPPVYWVREYNFAFMKRFRSPKQPFVRATWYMARDYCRWAGKRLLTEAEWEAAARGPKGTTYPWGNSPPDCTKANYRHFPPHTSYPRPFSIMRWCPHPNDKSKRKRFYKYGKDTLWDVDTTKPYRGIYHMAGNGYEWVQDVYNPNAYAGCDDPKSPHCKRVNPSGPCPKGKSKCTVRTKKLWLWKRYRVKVKRKIRGRLRTRYVTRYKRELRILRRPRRILYHKHILKGGSWWWYADRMRGASRRASAAFTGTHRLSIRCGSSKPFPKAKPPKKKNKLKRRYPLYTPSYEKSYRLKRRRRRSNRRRR